MIRALIVARVRLYREGLSNVLDAEDGIQIVETSADWSDSLTAARRVTPDLVLLEAALSEAGAAVAALRDAAPAAQIVALSIGDAESEAISWAEAGVSGFVTREDSLTRLVDVMRSVIRDEMPCSPRLASSLFRRVGALAASSAGPQPRARLTPRELQIVELIEQGLSNKEIGIELCIEVATVKNHVHNILEKLQVRRRAEAVARVRGRGPAKPQEEAAAL